MFTIPRDSVLRPPHIYGRDPGIVITYHEIKTAARTRIDQPLNYLLWLSFSYPLCFTPRQKSENSKSGFQWGPTHEMGILPTYLHVTHWQGYEWKEGSFQHMAGVQGEATSRTSPFLSRDSEAIIITCFIEKVMQFCSYKNFWYYFPAISVF